MYWLHESTILTLNWNPNKIPAQYQIRIISIFIVLLFQWIPKPSDWSYLKSSAFKLDMGPNKLRWSEQPWACGNSALDPGFAAGCCPKFKCHSEPASVVAAHAAHRKYSIQHFWWVFCPNLAQLFVPIPKLKLLLSFWTKALADTSLHCGINIVALIWIQISLNNCFTSK